jgi:LysR family transcriptional activator of nhaA
MWWESLRTVRCSKSSAFAARDCFPAAAVIAKEVEAQCKVRSIEQVPDVRERSYAVTVERRIKYPAVVAICEAAPTLVFPERALPPSK